MSENNETKLVFLGEAVIKLFALYTLLYYIFFHASYFLSQYIISTGKGPVAGEQLLQLSRTFLISLLPIGGAIILLWWGKDIANLLLPDETDVNLEYLKIEYIVSLLLTVIATYYVFSGGSKVFSWLIKWFLSGAKKIQVTYHSEFSSSLITGIIQLLFAFLLLLYLRPVASRINSRIFGENS